MRNLLERAAGIPALAKRWIAYVAEARALRAKVASLQRDNAFLKSQVDCLKRDVQVRDDVIYQWRRDEQKIPADALRLLKEAASLFELVARQRDFPVHFGLTWLGEWRALRIERERVAHDRELSTPP